LKLPLNILLLKYPVNKVFIFRSEGRGWVMGLDPVFEE